MLGATVVYLNNRTGIHVTNFQGIVPLPLVARGARLVTTATVTVQIWNTTVPTKQPEKPSNQIVHFFSPPVRLDFRQFYTIGCINATCYIKEKI
jgi:hypothetical protein